ncbi:MAG: serine hydrolase domain-containing protein [Planctomycetota bacterium]
MSGYSRRTFLNRAKLFGALPLAVWLSPEILWAKENRSQVHYGPLGEALLEELTEALQGATSPALGCGLLIDDKIRGIAASGQRARGQTAAVTIDDHWHLGSNTKSITATIAARLIDRGLLEWSTTIGEALPDLMNNRTKHWEEITLFELLTHRSGIPGGTGRRPTTWNGLWKISGTDLPIKEQSMRACRLILHEPQIHEPGKAYEYSNFGYIVAGTMLAGITQSSWHDLLRDEIAKPLGLESLGTGPPGRGAISQLTQPYGHVANTLTPIDPSEASADNPHVLGPAGTAHASIQDFLVYAATHANKGMTVSGDRFLTEEVTAQLHEPIDGYAGGWGVYEYENETILSHAGSNGMWFHLTQVIPSRRAACVVVANAADESSCTKLLGTMRQRFFTNE